MVLLFSAESHSVSAETSFEFRIPSNATSTTSRFFYNLIKEYEGKHPGVRIELVPSNTWDQVTMDVLAITKKRQDAGIFISEVSTTRELEKAQAAISFEDAMNVYGMDLFGDLESFKSQFVTKAMLDNSYGANGNFYAPPFIRSTPIAFYNLDEVGKIGYSEATLPETWTDIMTLLKRYKNATGKTPFGFGAVWSDYLFEATVRQAGGSLMNDDYTIVTFNTPEAIEALRFWKQMKDKDLLMKTNSWKATIHGFSAGLYPVIYYSSGGLGVASELADFKWAVKAMPRKKVHGVSLGGGNLYLSSFMSKQQLREALKFVHFLYSPKVQTAISDKTGFFPVTKEAFEAIENSQLNQLKHQFTNNQVYRKLMTVDNQKTRNILKEAINKALFGGASPKVTLDEAQFKVEKLLNEQK